MTPPQTASEYRIATSAHTPDLLLPQALDLGTMLPRLRLYLGVNSGCANGAFPGYE